MPGPMREMYLGWNIDVAEYNGDDSWRLPIPGRFVVDSGGIIRYAEADPDYMIRPEPEDTVEFVRRMTAGVQDADGRGHDRREVERRFRAERRQEEADIDFPDRRAGEDRRTGERRSGEDRRER
jgi:hypothetical protein